MLSLGLDGSYTDHLWQTTSILPKSHHSLWYLRHVLMYYVGQDWARQILTCGVFVINFDGSYLTLTEHVLF